MDFLVQLHITIKNSLLKNVTQNLERVLVNIVQNLWAPQKVGNFVTEWLLHKDSN
jgi:hypothetical protein